MTVKQFFKSSAFKCIAVLFSILIICGALLTVAYGFMAVSAGERLQRAVGSIYGGESVLIYGYGDKLIDAAESEPKSLVGETLELEDAEILSAYKIKFDGKSDVHYLVQSKGLHGYAEGSVTCWVAVNVDEGAKKILGIAKVQVGESAGQTFMNKITPAMLVSFTEADFAGGAPYFDPAGGYVSTGASLSSTAIDNAVNGAVKYVNEQRLGNAGGNFYETLALTSKINTAKTTAALNGTDVTYDVYTKGYGNAMGFHVTVTVGADGKIKSFAIAEGGNGSTEAGNVNYAELMGSGILDGSAFVGMGADYFTGLYGEEMNYTSTNLSGGTVTAGASEGNASQSTYLCMCAGAFATANYSAVYGYLSGGAR